ncbi:MAG: divalent-cation tolerance protein CutA [Candidatus Polarisedimenticolaceae bacterium]|nr:divalent-cation tolerance protein CutA [Candidatus Polarisedimenticolaceae bacterium]
MPTSALLILCNCPNQASAEEIATMLLEERLAACISISAPVTSIYRWQGKLQKEQEVMLIIKSTQQCYQALETALKSAHPYELPEIIAVSVEQGLPAYLNWLTECTKES